ncbi:Arc family DNA-binding protein [Sulfitobacter sp. EhC04]|uniref:Arc family DNA-binding protein n=1 Tax=Sulfitobacter sp. EhC04 TaxID=1849168 RepID=UPI0009EEE2A9|nr:Arc family DNA-binding protein [Sulfitobacter sp. EhC04]
MSDTRQFKLNLPTDLFDQLSLRTERSLRSVSAEIIFILREVMEDETPTPQQ